MRDTRTRRIVSLEMITPFHFLEILIKALVLVEQDCSSFHFEISWRVLLLLVYREGTQHVKFLSVR